MLPSILSVDSPHGMRSIDALLPDDAQPLRFARELGAFAAYMRVERGLSPVTIATREVRMRRFFSWLAPSSLIVFSHAGD